MTDLSIASFASPAPYALRDRATDVATSRDGGKPGSFTEMEERLEKQGNARPDQRKGRAAPSDPAGAGSTTSKETRPVTGQAMPPADATSDPLALLIDLSVSARSRADDGRNEQAFERENAGAADIGSQIPPTPVPPPDRTADRTSVDGNVGGIVGDTRAERFETINPRPDQVAERLVLSAREIMIAVAGGRRERLDAGSVEPSDVGQPADQDAMAVAAPKSDPIAQLIGVAAVPVPVVGTQHASSSSVSTRQASPSDILSPAAPSLADAQNAATTEPIDQGPHDSHRQGRPGSPSVGDPALGAGLKVSEIIDVDSASHFAPAGSAMQQVATAVRETLGPAPAAPVARPEFATTREAPPPLQVLNLKLQPESLGNLAIHMRLSGETLSMHIKVSDAATLASFQSGSSKLEDLLKASGYQVDKLTIVAAAPPSVADQAPSGEAGARRDGNPSTMTPSGEQSQERSGQAQDGHRGGERQGGFQDGFHGGFKGNGGQSHEAPAPRTPRVGVYL